jgi:hypothetical protein
VSFVKQKRKACSAERGFGKSLKLQAKTTYGSVKWKEKKAKPNTAWNLTP